MWVCRMGVQCGLGLVCEGVDVNVWETCVMVGASERS